MGGEPTEGKTRPSPISTSWSHTMSPGMQRSHKAMQLFQWRQGRPPNRHAASPTVAQQDQTVCHGDSGEGRKERGGWPIGQGTAMALERGSGWEVAFLTHMALVASLIPPPLR